MKPSDLSEPSASLPAAWAQQWRRDPGRPVLHDQGNWITAGQLEDQSRQVTGRWHRAGLEPGDRVLFSSAPSAELVIAHVGALRMGLVVVPVNPALREPELFHVLDDARPRAAVVDDAIRSSQIKSHSPAVVISEATVSLPPGPSPGLDQCEPDAVAMLCYTSGTTGKPKAALLSHANLLAGADALRHAWRWDSDDRLVLALPLFHIHGLGIGLHGTLLANASAVLLRHFDPSQVLEAAIEHRASLFFGVPTMYNRLVTTSGCEGLARLRLCVSGSAPLSVELHHEISARCGQQVLERYGLTETMINTANPYDGERRPGSVGFALPGVELRLGPGGGPGPAEIEVRGPSVCSGYWNQPGASAAAFRPGGWFQTGDVGQFDRDGYLHIVGRIKELIITGGFNVYPREVEDVLRNHPDVTDVAVVGTPSREWGEVVTAVVVPAGVGDAQALMDYARARLAPYKQPRLVRFVDQLPRNAMGKVLRSGLAEP
ncbi:MAG: class I adenylate-forming enzyme family protein [Acidimicrobiales bacterium]